MRNLKRTGCLLVLGILLTGCETTGMGGSLGSGIGQGLIEGILMGPSDTYGNGSSAPAPARQTSVSSGGSGGSYLDRMIGRSLTRVT